MARYKVEYNIHIGDYVHFKDYKGDIIQGTIQCVRDFPTIWIEVGYPHYDDYRRYETTADRIVYIDKIDWKKTKTKFDDDEALEYIWTDNTHRKVTGYYGH